jgi:DNA-binding SARP family transcriptional activator
MCRMTDQETIDPIGLWQEIEQGILYAMQSYYPDATTHFLKVRAHTLSTHPRFAAIIDAFLSGHTRYWAALQTLHTASQSFTIAHAEQVARLDELRQLITEGFQELMHPTQTTAVAAHVAQESPARPLEQTKADLPALTITCFGRFTVQRQGTLVTPCSNRNSQAILRYLVAQPQHCESTEVLMELFWPNDAPDVARHKLHVAISSLRRMLNSPYVNQKGTGYLVCDNGVYELNTAVAIHIDVDDFVLAYQAGQHTTPPTAIEHYENACQLYIGPFLVEDLYADWSQIRREQLVQMYLTMCAALVEHCLANERYDPAIDWAGRILSENRCDEAAYRQLMRAYSATGRRTDALRQFQRCKRSLNEEMGIEPASETIALFQRLQRGEPLSSVALAFGT